MVIDDEEDFTLLIKTALEETGKYEVRTENAGKKGLAAVQAFKPDLVLLDILMPDVEGSYIAEEIKKDEKIKNTPIVFLTATVTKEEIDATDGMMGGGYPFMAKPVTINSLIECIEKHTQ